MKYQWQRSLARAFVWLCAEIGLSVMGIDHLADYSEFIFECSTSLHATWQSSQLDDKELQGWAVRSASQPCSSS